MDNENQSIKKLEQEVEDKKKIYTSLLKENPPLYKIYRMTKTTDIGGLLGMILAVMGLLEDPFLLLLGVVILIASLVALYRFNKQFDRLFDETASDTLKSARKEYEEYDHRLKEAKEANKKAKKEEERAKLQTELDKVEQITNSRSHGHDNEYEEGELESKEEREEFFRGMLAKIYTQEIAFSHLVYTGDLSDMIYKNTFAAQSIIDKAMVLFGQIVHIDYDKRRQMPYLLIGSGHYIHSSSFCDRYACYFSDPNQIETLKNLQVHDNVSVCGIFSENDRELPSTYILLQCYILDIRPHE